MKNVKKSQKPSGTLEDADAEEEGEEEEEEWAPEKLPSLPKALNERLSWDEFEASLKPAPNKKTAAVTSEQLRAAAQAVGLSELPPSYVEYVQRFGNRGEWELVYRRERFPRFLNIAPPTALKERKSTFARRVDARLEGDAEERAVARAVRTLLPFGTDASAIDICWDPALKARAGDLGICFVDRGSIWRSVGAVRADLGSHLLDTLKYFRPR
jgi:hypothetical protein